MQIVICEKAKLNKVRKLINIPMNSLTFGKVFLCSKSTKIKIAFDR